MVDPYAVCARIARRHYENFPVASVLLPPPMRPHIAAIYAFARTADDFADEGDRSPEDRLALLDEWGRRLGASIDRGIDPSTHQVIDLPIRPDDANAIFEALHRTIDACRLDVRLFGSLLSAFRQDVVVTRYDSWEALFDYCRRSANPVGRLVLAVAGVRGPAVEAASDALCTGLQLANFWQDLARDWARGRLYVPLAEVRAAGAREQDLEAHQITPAWREALREASLRTRRCFAAGRAVADQVAGRLRWELRATWLGGVRVLDRLEASGFDVFARRPSLGWRDVPALAWQVATWRRGAGIGAGE